MSFLSGKWRALDKLKQVKAKYGENTNLISRSQYVNHPEGHSFPELINKVYPVEDLHLPEWMYDDLRYSKSFAITDSQKVNQALKRSAKTPES